MEDEFFLRRVRELALRALHRGDVVYTHFLDLAQAQAVGRIARETGVSLAMNGGYADAERRMAAFYGADAPAEGDWPICPVRIVWRPQFGSPGHRDILGALMGLGFERERIGDIVLDEGCAWLFAEPEMASYIAGSLESAGRVNVRCEIAKDVSALPEPEGRHVRDTVPSMRLDALVAAGFSLSRAEAARAIGQGKVYLNQAQTLRTDAAVPENALISLRGKGRFRLEAVEGETRKGRWAVRLFLYGD
ncbi:MAG: hypothetical protein IKO07_13230 [Clostridia bacterium]|nr:hypothetical protein [Clostridia bacterium]